MNTIIKIVLWIIVVSLLSIIIQPKISQANLLSYRGKLRFWKGGYKKIKVGKKLINIEARHYIKACAEDSRNSALLLITLCIIFLMISYGITK
jgi:hypothetical protein